VIGGTADARKPLPMNAIYGLFTDPESAQRAVDGLREAGVERRAIQAMSSQPLEEQPFGREDAQTPMPWLAVFGGVIGGFSGYYLAALTQKAYPLPTGGMPIVALWANGIITYELIMLGAIIATLLALLLSTRLPDWSRKLYDPAVSDGKILVGVINPPEESRIELERQLREAGASEIKQFPPEIAVKS
jgi:Protein of unknown function (DUF3341)